MTRRSSYAYRKVANDHVIIADMDLPGTMSVTNNAEAVVREVLAIYPGRRIGYVDTDGRLDELTHNGSQFTGFGIGFPFAID